LRPVVILLGNPSLLLLYPFLFPNLTPEEDANLASSGIVGDIGRIRKGAGIPSGSDRKTSWLLILVQNLRWTGDVIRKCWW
jgi:hypothetical protein